MKYDPRYSDGPVWAWFGLSYSSYAVLPRRALCSMPIEWQERFVTLMREAAVALPGEAQCLDYFVRARDSDGKFCADPNVPYRHAKQWKLTTEKEYPFMRCTGGPIDPLERCSVCGGVGWHNMIDNPEYVRETT